MSDGIPLAPLPASTPRSFVHHHLHQDNLRDESGNIHHDHLCRRGGVVGPIYADRGSDRGLYAAQENSRNRHGKLDDIDSGRSNIYRGKDVARDGGFTEHYVLSLSASPGRPVRLPA